MQNVAKKLLTIAKLCNIVTVGIAKFRNLKGGLRVITVKLNNLEAEMKRIGINRLDIAKLIGVSYRTVHSKFNGESQWQYAECVLVRDTYFPEKELSYLFPYAQQEVV